VTTVSPSAPQKRKRLRSVTLIALAVLYLGVINLARAWLAWTGNSFEQGLTPRMPLPYLVIVGCAWGGVFVAAGLGLWRLQPWARRLVLIAIVVYQLHIWINHLLLDTSSYARQVWPFQAAISAAWLLGVWSFMFLPGIRRALQPG
jgi:hypothetical protein